MSRDISLRRLGADTFLFRHSAPQSFERALVIGEWSSSGSRCFVSSPETVRFFFLPVRFFFLPVRFFFPPVRFFFPPVRFFFPPVVPFYCRDGAIRFLKQA